MIIFNLHIEFFYYLLHLTFLDIYFFTCSDFISTKGLDINSCNFIYEVCDCMKLVSHLYILSKRLPT